MPNLNPTHKKLQLAPALRKDQGQDSQIPGQTQSTPQAVSPGVKPVLDLAPTTPDTRAVMLKADPQAVKIIKSFKKYDLFSNHEWTKQRIRKLEKLNRDPVPENQLTLEKATKWVQVKIGDIQPHEMSPEDDWFMSDRDLDFFLDAWPSIWRELNRRLFEKDGATVATYFVDLDGYREQFASQAHHYFEAWTLRLELKTDPSITPGDPWTFKQFILEQIRDGNFADDPSADILGHYLAMFTAQETWPELLHLLGPRLLAHLKQAPYRYLQLVDYGCPIDYWLSFAGKPLPDFRALFDNLHRTMCARKAACEHAGVDVEALQKDLTCSFVA